MTQSNCEPEPNDGALVERIRGGSMEAFDALVERHRRAIYRLAFAMTQDHEAADDLSQEVFVQLFRRIRQLRSPESVGAWLRRILVNLCIKHSRRVRHVSIDDEGANPEPSATDTPFAAAEKSMVKDQVRQAILELDPHERAVVLLYYMDGLKQVEIAEVLGRPVGTVWSRLSSARGKLRSRLANVIAGVEDGVENA